MREEIDCPSAAQWGEELRAEQKLAKMEFLDDLACLAESEACPRLRARLAERYRSVIGVSPGRRDELRSALQRIKSGGGMPVDEAVDSINRAIHANGSFSGAGVD